MRNMQQMKKHFAINYNVYECQEFFKKGNQKFLLIVVISWQKKIDIIIIIIHLFLGYAIYSKNNFVKTIKPHVLF